MTINQITYIIKSTDRINVNPAKENILIKRRKPTMKKLLAVLLTLALMLGMCSALAEDEPINLSLWTFL